MALLHRCILVLPSFSPLATSSARPPHHAGVSKMINQLYFLPSGRVVLPTARNSFPSGPPQTKKSPPPGFFFFHIPNFPPYSPTCPFMSSSPTKPLSARAISSALL